MLWNGLGPPAADELPVFSWFGVFPPKLISPSLSSLLRLRPQILHATIPSPIKMMAPPMPTTTPMTVLRVLADMPVDFLGLPSLLSSPVAEGAAEVVVYDETWLTKLPEMVLTTVVTTTLGVGVDFWVLLVVGLALSVEVEESDDDGVWLGLADDDVGEALAEGVVEEEVVIAITLDVDEEEVEDWEGVADSEVGDTELDVGEAEGEEEEDCVGLADADEEDPAADCDGCVPRADPPVTCLATIPRP